MDSIADAPVDGPIDAAAKGGKGKKKLFKKASSGLVSSQRSYFDCREARILSNCSLTVKRDATRGETKHDLNAFEVRDLIPIAVHR